VILIIGKHMPISKVYMCTRKTTFWVNIHTHCTIHGITIHSAVTKDKISMVRDSACHQPFLWRTLLDNDDNNTQASSGSEV